MSIFDHYQTATELPDASQGISKYHYEKIRPDRGTVGLSETNKSFVNAEIDYTFNIPANKHWVPQRSYFRLRGKIMTTGDVQLTRSVGIAPSMNFMGNLFQAGTFKINDVPISIINKHLTKIDTLETRMSKSKAWLDSVGSSMNFWDADFNKRLDKICSDSRDDTLYEVFDSTQLVDSVGHGFVSPTTTFTTVSATGVVSLGGGNEPNVQELFKRGDIFEYKLVAGTSALFRAKITDIPSAITFTIGDGFAVGSALTAGALNYGTGITFRILRPYVRRSMGFEMCWVPPFSAFKLNKALPVGKYQISLTPETEDIIKIKAIESLVENPGNFHFHIDEMNFYASTMIAQRRDNYNYVLNLDETECHPVILSGSSGDIQVTVSPNTYAITVAFQDIEAGRKSLYSDSKFKVRPTSGVNQDLNLTSLQINYAGEDKPTPQADPSFNATTTVDYFTQLYNNTLLYSGRYFSSGGAETLEEFRLRGGFYYFPFPKDDSDDSTRVAIRYSFSDLTSNQANLLVFEHRKNNARVTISNSEVTDVAVERK